MLLLQSLTKCIFTCTCKGAWPQTCKSSKKLLYHNYLSCSFMREAAVTSVSRYIRPWPSTYTICSHHIVKINPHLHVINLTSCSQCSHCQSYTRHLCTLFTRKSDSLSYGVDKFISCNCHGCKDQRTAWARLPLHRHNQNNILHVSHVRWKSQERNSEKSQDNVFADERSTPQEHSKSSPGGTVKELKKEIVLTVPNVLTMSRVVMTPVLGYLVLQESFSWACGMFAVAGMTDLLDGWIARNFKNQMSAFGSFMDPLADKLLVSTLYITLTAVDLLPVPLTVLVLARDVFLIAGAFYIRYITLPPPRSLGRYFDVTMPTAQLKPLLISKINTAVQLSLVVLTLAAPVFSYVDHPALQALWYITAATTFASGVGYIFAKDTFRTLQEIRKKSKD